ncbi:MAG: hypothetical protein ABR615_04010, partial [Pseudonocardiaceae bacterium]
MPDIQKIGLDLSPSEHPLSYPGKLVTANCLLFGSWLYVLRPIPGLPLADWSVQHDGGPLSLTNADRLGTVLPAARVAPMARRSAVVAVGSNAAPGQLSYKYRDHLHHNIIPITHVITSNLTVAHSAHVSKAGYIPFIPVLTEGARRLKLSVLWLDDEQLRRMDDTEPNYTRVAIESPAVRAQLDSGLFLESFDLYRGRWGALCSEPGIPPIMATSQAGVYSFLSTHQWFRLIVPELRDGPQSAAAALAHDEARRRQIRH